MMPMGNMPVLKLLLLNMVLPMMARRDSMLEQMVLLNKVRKIIIISLIL